MTPEVISTMLEMFDAAGQPKTIGNLPYVLIPKGYDLHVRQDAMPKPLRVDRTIEAFTPEAFVDYFRQFQTEHSRVFCNTRTGEFIGIIDYHGAGQGEQQWCAHVVKYVCPLSTEWLRWKGASGKFMTQVEFAEFIEDNLRDVAQPAAADLLEIVTTLEASKSVSFKSGVRLDNGQVNLSYVENVDGMAGKVGQFLIPNKIVLGIRVLHHGAAYAIDANFRYRIVDATLKMKFDILNLQGVEEKAIGDVHALLSRELGAGLVFEAGSK